ncbi:MAG: hypothetical protein WCS94_19305, partial [Verrucomicrobiota bacterium]
MESIKLFNPKDVMKQANKPSGLFLVALGLLLHSIAWCQQSAPVVEEAQIIARVKAMGDGATVDDVMREVSKLPKKSNESPPNDYEKVRLIEKINTDAARRALFELAVRIRKDNDCYEAAAAAYVRILPDKRGATNLLQSTDRFVLSSAFRGLQGCKVDDDLWRQLKPLLASQDINIRLSVFGVLNSSPTPVPENMIRAVVDSSAGFDQMPDAQKVILIPTASESGYQDTKSGMAYASFAHMLGRWKDASLEMLAKWTPTEAGNFRDAMLIARALKKDDSLKPELQRIICESSLPSLRVAALWAFANLATKDDLPFLQHVAANDSWVVVPRGQIFYKLESLKLPTDNYYPNFPGDFQKSQQNRWFPVFVWLQSPVRHGSEKFDQPQRF